MLPLTLVTSATVVTSGLLDTGAAVNVLPYEIGMKLGLNWDGQTTPIRLTGNLASVEARVIIVSASIASFSPVRLAFAWVKDDTVPLLLGQVNFFMEFDVCFFRSRGI